MPGLFDGTCGSCGATGWFTDYAYGVFLADETVVLLPHPGEDSAIRKHGFSWNEAGLQGRVVLADFMACEECGELWTKQQLLSPGPYAPNPLRDRPFLIVLHASFIVGGGAAFVFWNHWVGMGAAVATAVVGFALGWAFDRWRLRREAARWEAEGQRLAGVIAERAAKVKSRTAQCARCNGVRAVRLIDVNAPVEKVRCPGCCERTLTLVPDGIS